MYAVIYKPAAGGDPAEILQVVNSNITPEAWNDGSGVSYENCADASELETFLAGLDADWATKVDVRYYMK